MNASRQHGLLAWIERTGNRLPEPVMLFMLACVLVLLLSQLAVWLNWSVAHPVKGKAAVTAVGLLSADGIWWWLSSMVDVFVRFPPLGLVLVGMLGIGIAERSGFISALLQLVMRSITPQLLTPTVILLGILSSLALDAGYLVLPPLAALLFQAAGRAPLAGIAAAFAGVSAGFSANLLITAIDPLLSGLTQSAATLLEPGYRVAVTANWWFMMVSTLCLTLLGWWVSARYVEPRLQYTAASKPAPSDGTQVEVHQQAIRLALLSALGVLLLMLFMVWWPQAPLHGQGKRFARWIEAMVPLVALFFVVPGLVYGFRAGTLRSHRDVVQLLGDTLSHLGPYIVLAFFASQFIALFAHSQLGVMLAIVGGQALALLALPPALLMAGFIVIVMLGNLFIGSASAKYALFAPVFVPMFMLAGISPELTQAAYRVGDSVSNVVTPLNPYWVIILAFARQYAPQTGMGTLAAMMLPYTLVFALAWTALLALWVVLGVPLGPGGALSIQLH